MADTEAIDGEDLIEGLEAKKFSGKKMVIIGGGVAVILLIAVVLFLTLGGDDGAKSDGDPVLDEASQAAAAQNAATQQDGPPEEIKTIFYDLEPQQYDLNTGGQGRQYLLAEITLELDRESFRADVEQKLPRILDEFNIYMRELHPEDLTGSRGILFLKEELLARINQSIAPTRVRDVLFKKFIIQ